MDYFAWNQKDPRTLRLINAESAQSASMEFARINGLLSVQVCISEVERPTYVYDVNLPNPEDLNKGGHEGRIARLRDGQIIKFSEKGNSMVPKIYSGQECTYAPIFTDADINVGNAVYCKVQGNYYTHLVTAIRSRRGSLQYQISNNKGRVNGWVGLSQIFGKVIEVAGVPIRW